MLFIGRMPFIVTVFGCAIVLGMALVLEYGFGVVGCALCKYERMIMFIGGLLALPFIFTPARWRPAGFALVGLVFLGGFVLSLYHVLIQQGIFPLPSFCKPPAISGELSLEEMRNQLLNTPFVPCNKVTWSLFGLSLAMYSMLFTGAVAAYNFIALMRSRRER